MNNTQVVIQKMEIASRFVDRSLAIDASAPSLLDLMNIHHPQLSTASGLSDHDYPILSGAPLALNNIAQIKIASKVPLPPEILEHFSHIQCHCMMGLFPEIKRAWLTVDSDIYVWSYEDNSDLAYFDGLNETIMSVGLVKPKHGVFHAFIKHLLVLTTAVDVIVLGVTFTAGQNGPLDEIQLIPDPVFTIPTDGTTFSAIACTALGRLFLGSKEGWLYEIVYQAESGWFGKRCKKINHSTSPLSFLVPSFLNAALSEEDGIVQITIDNSRHILYVLTEKGSIEVYDLGAKGDSFSKITKVNQNTLVNQAVHIVKTLDSQNFRPIVSISAVEASESNHLYLVATTQTGVRFYLTTHTLNVPSNQRPYTLFLLHVRLPPGYSANVTIRPRAVHIAHHKNRNFLLLSTVNEKDVLWCISSDLFPFSQSLMEAYTTISLDGPALAMAEVIQEDPLHDINQDGLPLVVRQHSEPPKKYVILTSEGVYIFSKLRPVDMLRLLLSESQGLNSESVKAFFMIQKEDQACATSLIIASLDVDDNLELAEYATRAFFMYGGEPKVTVLPNLNQTSMISGTSAFSPNVVSTPAPSHHYQRQTSPPQQPASVTYSSFDITSPFLFSSKHNGLYLYLGRILKPIWNRKCVEKICLDGKNILNASTLTSNNCRWILTYLTTLHNFLLSNTQLATCDNSSLQITLNNTRLNATNRMNHTLQDAQVEEGQSLNALKIFVSHCCQIMGLWRILCEHQFHVLIGSLPANHQILQETTFKDLFLYGHDICSSLITTLVDSYLGDNASVDSINAKLREVCPQLYRLEDAAFSKANEMLKSSRNTQNVDEKEEMVQSALDLCKSIAPNENLKGICKQFVSLKAFYPVIDLCVTCAKKIDPDNVAEHFYKSDSAMGDQEGRNFYHKRMDIYKEVFSMLDSLYNESSTSLNTPSTQLIERENRAIVDQLILDILEIPDEILHVGLYDWMMKKQLSSELIKVNNASLETYLVRTSQQNPENLPVVDLLWKYYENNNNHAAAAKILDSLASKTGNNLGLKERIEYLTRAIMCMRSDKIGYAPYLGMFLRDLEDKMEVAKVQEQILDAVTALKGIHPAAEEAIVALNSGLYQISQLYENFADPLELWECQLAIIECAGYSDQNLIEKIWRNILRREIRKSVGHPNNRMAQILAKVKNVARQFGVTTNCFPTAFLVSEFEQLSTYLKSDTYLVPKAFVSMEIKTEVLLEIYNRLIASMSEIQIWQKEENEFHLFQAVAALIETFLTNHSAYNSIEKRTIIAQCQDTVASLLSILYSKPNTDELINVLRGIQSKLSRL